MDINWIKFWYLIGFIVSWFVLASSFTLMKVSPYGMINWITLFALLPAGFFGFRTADLMFEKEENIKWLLKKR